MRNSFCLLVLFSALARASAPQTPPERKPSFDIVSIKPNKLGGPPRRIGTEGNRFIAENVPLIILIQLAYGTGAIRLAREHVIGGPAWINTERFDIETRSDTGRRLIPTDQTWRMVEAFLVDRFKLKVHRETRQLPVYNLVVAKNGMKIKLADDQTPPSFDDQEEAPFDAAAPPPRGEAITRSTASGETVLMGTAIGISPNLSSRRPHALLPHGLTTLLSGNVGRPVIDKTNLKGLFDFRLQFTPDRLLSNPDALGISLFTAVEQQLGLKLESAKGPVEVIVIDSVAKPSEN